MIFVFIYRSDQMTDHPIRRQAVAGLKAGDRFTRRRTFTKAETELFGDLTRDYNPVHYEPRWTEAKGFDGLICHGLLVGAMICEFGGQIGWLASGMQFKFIRPVYFNQAITCTFTITRVESSGRAEAEATFTDESGETVCVAGLSGRVPVNGEREILQRMIDEGDPTNKLGG